jgi:hypothetical protein
MSVPIRVASNGQALEKSAPVPLFVTNVGGAVQGTHLQHYAVSPDGTRFLMNTMMDVGASPITVILNWKARP